MANIITCRCCGKKLAEVDFDPAKYEGDDLRVKLMDSGLDEIAVQNAIDNHCSVCKGEIDSFFDCYDDSEVVTYERKEVYTNTFADRTDTFREGKLEVIVNYDPGTDPLTPTFIWVNGPRGRLYFESHFCGNSITRYYAGNDIDEEIEYIISTALKKGGAKRLVVSDQESKIAEDKEWDCPPPYTEQAANNESSFLLALLGEI